MYFAEWTCILQGYMLHALTLYILSTWCFSRIATNSRSIYHNEKKLSGRGGIGANLNWGPSPQLKLIGTNS